MRIFTYGETSPQIPPRPEQKPLQFKAVPYYTGDKELDALSLPEEILAHKDQFPLIEDFELVIIDGRQNPPEKSLGSDIMAQFIDRAKNQRITYWDMYYVDMLGPEKSIPMPMPGQLIEEIELRYLILITADEAFVYVAYSEDEGAKPPTYSRYCKIPKERYESEWKSFVQWYHEHPEKRHPYPTPEERMTHSARSPDGSLKKHGGWLSKFFK